MASNESKSIIINGDATCAGRVDFNFCAIHVQSESLNVHARLGINFI